MASFEVSGRNLRLRFSALETVGGLRRGARVPLADVASVEVAREPWREVSGMRVGTGVPGTVLLGTMLRFGRNDVIALYGRAPAIIVRLRPGAAWQRLIATVPDPERVAEELQAAIA